MRATRRWSTGPSPSSQRAVKRRVSEDMPLPSGLVTSVITGSLPAGKVSASHRWSCSASFFGSRVDVVMRSGSISTRPSAETAPDDAFGPMLFPRIRPQLLRASIAPGRPAPCRSFDALGRARRAQAGKTGSAGRGDLADDGPGLRFGESRDGHLSTDRGEVEGSRLDELLAHHLRVHVDGDEGVELGPRQLVPCGSAGTGQRDIDQPPAVPDLGRSRLDGRSGQAGRTQYEATGCRSRRRSREQDRGRRGVVGGGRGRVGGELRVRWNARVAGVTGRIARAGGHHEIENGQPGRCRAGRQGTGGRGLSGGSGVVGSCTEPVSYTHLTLPT